MSADSKALLALVADLAQLGDEDIQAILGELDPDARRRLDALMARYRQGDHAPTVDNAPITPLSGWLTDRLAVNDDARSTGMTPHGSETLRRIARMHGWSPTRDAAAAPSPRRPLLSRLGRGA